MKRLLITILSIALLISSVFSANLTGTVSSVDKYGNETTTISVETALKEGYETGDLVRVKVGSWETVAPIGTSYSDVDVGSPIVMANSEYIAVAINHGNFANTSGEKEGSSVTISMESKGGYLSEFMIRHLVRTDERTDYPYDSVFANFRMVTAGDIKNSALYRSCSPVRGDSRAPYADSLAETAQIRTVLNLADSPESVTEYIADAPYYSSLLDSGRVALLDMDVDFFSADFQKKLKDGLEFLAKNGETPVLIHCNEGKDRAGMVSALIEALCGASMDEIVEDYMKSFENYYGVEPGTEQYDVISNAVKTTFITMNGKAFPWDSVGKVAENYVLNTLSVSADDLSAIRNLLTK